MVFQNKCLAKNIPNEEEASGPETESEVLLNFRMRQIVRAKFFALTIGKTYSPRVMNFGATAFPLVVGNFG